MASERRDTRAALLVAQGAHPLAVMQRLGHSSITVTMNTYGHLFPELDEALTAGFDAAYRAALDEKRASVVARKWHDAPETESAVVDMQARNPVSPASLPVAGDGVDPSTPRFSGVCSAN
jgi:hypothetical protein